MSAYSNHPAYKAENIPDTIVGIKEALRRLKENKKLTKTDYQVVGSILGACPRWTQAMYSEFNMRARHRARSYGQEALSGWSSGMGGR